MKALIQANLKKHRLYVGQECHLQNESQVEKVLSVFLCHPGPLITPSSCLSKNESGLSQVHQRLNCLRLQAARPSTISDTLKGQKQLIGLQMTTVCMWELFQVLFQSKRKQTNLFGFAFVRIQIKSGQTLHNLNSFNLIRAVYCCQVQK